jgi:potassium-transporting ATPase KdpC subunit
MRRQLLPSVVMVLVFTLVTGLAYPLAVTGLGQLAFHDRAEGSLVRDRDGDVVGSGLLGQTFTSPRYFHPRPSAAGDGYDPRSSGGSNLGPTNERLLDTVAERADAYRDENDLPASASVPVDAVTASASGLDPDISVANARIQARRVAETRGMDLDDVLALFDEHTSDRPLGFLGEPGVNVLRLNLALDSASGAGGADGADQG